MAEYALLEVKQRKDLGNFPDVREIIFEKFVFLEFHEYGQNTNYFGSPTLRSKSDEALGSATRATVCFLTFSDPRPED